MVNLKSRMIMFLILLRLVFIEDYLNELIIYCLINEYFITKC